MCRDLHGPADSAAASRALAAGDALGALNYVALRDDAQALALRGIAMAQLNDLAARPAIAASRGARLWPRTRRSRGALHARRGRDRAGLARSRLARQIARKPRAAALERGGDRANAAHARYLAIRRLVLIGRLDEAERLVAAFDPAPLPAASRAAFHLVVVRHRRAASADRGGAGGASAGGAFRARGGARPRCSPRSRPAPQRSRRPPRASLARGEERSLRLDEVEALFASDALVVDACRLAVRRSGRAIPLGARPVLFALARALAQAQPDGRDARRPGQPSVSRQERRRIASRAAARRDRPIARARSTGSRRFRRPEPASRSRRAAAAPSPCSRRRPRRSTPKCLRCSADGEAWSSSALALALRRARAPCSGRCKRTWPRRARRSRSGAAAPGAGWRRPPPGSRQACYSRSRPGSTRIAA